LGHFIFLTFLVFGFMIYLMIVAFLFTMIVLFLPLPGKEIALPILALSWLLLYWAYREEI